MGEVMDYAKRYCRHCEREALCRNRGLCKRCYNNPRIRNRYPRLAYQVRRDGRIVPNQYTEYTTVPNLPYKPTQAQPGSEEKMLILEERMRAGTQLFHPLDKNCFVEPNAEAEVRNLAS